MTSLRPAERPRPPSPSNLPVRRPPRRCWLIDVSLCHLLVYDVFLGLVRPNRREGADRPNPCATARAKPQTPMIPPTFIIMKLSVVVGRCVGAAPAGWQGVEVVGGGVIHSRRFIVLSCCWFVLDARSTCDHRTAMNDNGDFVWGAVKVEALLFLVVANAEKYTNQRRGG